MPAVVHWDAVRMPLLDGDHTLVPGLAYVTANYFDMLGARPALSAASAAGGRRARCAAGARIESRLLGIAVRQRIPP